ATAFSAYPPVGDSARPVSGSRAPVSTTTWVPTSAGSSPSPTAATRPVTPDPGTSGGATWKNSLPQPLRICTSRNMTLAAATSTTAWPGPATGSGSSTGRSTSGAPYSSTCTARMSASFRSRRRDRSPATDSSLIPQVHLRSRACGRGTGPQRGEHGHSPPGPPRHGGRRGGCPGRPRIVAPPNRRRGDDRGRRPPRPPPGPEPRGYSPADRHDGAALGPGVELLARRQGQLPGG